MSTVADLAAEMFGVAPAPAVARFAKAGWSYDETIDGACPQCSGPLHALSKPYESGGKEYRYAAFVCAKCVLSFTLQDLGHKSRDAMKRTLAKTAKAAQTPSAASATSAPQPIDTASGLSNIQERTPINVVAPSPTRQVRPGGDGQGGLAVDAQRVSNYGEGFDLYETLLKLMSTAARRLWIKVAWWDASPRARLLADAVIAACRKGVEVIVICRPEASNDAILRDLRRAGITIVGVRFIHEKELLADEVAVSHSMNFTSREIERNQNSGFIFKSSDVVAAMENGFRTLMDNGIAATVGDEEWTPSAKLIPPELQKYLTRFDRLNPLQSKAVPAVLSTTGHVMVVVSVAMKKSPVVARSRSPLVAR